MIDLIFMSILIIINLLILNILYKINNKLNGLLLIYKEINNISITNIDILHYLERKLKWYKIVKKLE